MNRANQRGFNVIGVAIVIVASFLLFFTSCSMIGTGEVGVPKVFGKVQGYTLTPGAHLLNPLATVPKVNVQTQNYTMSHVSAEGNKSGDDSVDVISSDGLKVNMDITVLYNIDAAKAPFIVSTIAGDINESIIRPQIRAAIRDNAAAHTAVDLYSAKKDVFVANVQKQLDANLNKYGVSTQQVLLRSIQLPNEVMQAITAKMQAQQASQAMQFKLDQERQEAERKRVQAQGEADYNRINQQQLTPAILEARRIEAFKTLASSGNVVVVPQSGNLLLNLPSKK